MFSLKFRVKSSGFHLTISMNRPIYTGNSKTVFATMDNSGKGPLKVPGFGLPVDHELFDSGWFKEKGFRHGITDFSADRLTMREVAMLRFMDAVTDKPDWNRKVFDDKINSKWREEAKGDRMMSENTFEWCITELREKAQEFEEDGKEWIKTLDSHQRRPSNLGEPSSSTKGGTSTVVTSQRQRLASQFKQSGAQSSPPKLIPACLRTYPRFDRE